MPRHFRTEAGLETGMFSVHQMHPEAALRLALSVTLAGLGKQGRSVQTMITEYGTALVIVSADVDYLGELTFFPESSVIAEAAVSLREDGRLVTFRVRVAGRDTPAIGVRIGLRPIRLTGGPALDALPGPLPPEFRALFDPDEIVAKEAVPTRTLQADVRRDLADADPILSAERALFIGRSDCELADQWLAARLPSLVATARDELLFSGEAELAECAKRPVATFRSEFFRPMYFGDRGRIHVTAYRKGGGSSSPTTFAPNRSPTPKGRCARSRSKPSDHDRG